MTRQAGETSAAPTRPKAEWVAPVVRVLNAQAAEFGSGESPDGPYPPS